MLLKRIFCRICAVFILLTNPSSPSPPQVKLELIRQAESLDQVKEILEEGAGDDRFPPADAS